MTSEGEHRHPPRLKPGRLKIPKHLEQGDLSTFLSWAEERRRQALLAACVRDEAEVLHVFAAMAEGSFGNCYRCGVPIDRERLRSRPWVRECSECQDAGQVLSLVRKSSGSVRAVAA